MRTTVDKVGRLVIPKALRDALGIGPDATVELIPDGTGLRLEPVTPAPRPVEVADGLPVLGYVEGVVLSDDDVRRQREDLQR